MNMDNLQALEVICQERKVGMLIIKQVKPIAQDLLHQI